MNLLKDKILTYFPHWNERVHTEKDGDLYCQKRGAIKIETDLIDDLGEYRVQRGHPIILLHSFVTDNYRNWVFLHECGHDLFHSPLSCKFSHHVRRKIEFEANVVAAVALIPVGILRTKTLWEIQDEYLYPRKLILLRKYIWDNYKV
jgi:Zn-dependent peptidase ImmA (M78 family)